jgi:hypothetical protein
MPPLRVVLAALLALCVAGVGADSAPHSRIALRRIIPRRSAAEAPAPMAGAAAQQPSCTASGPLEAEKRVNVSMQFGGLNRTFLLMLPKDFNNTPSPLILAMHGAGSSAAFLLDGGACRSRCCALLLRAGARAAKPHGSKQYQENSWR